MNVLSQLSSVLELFLPEHCVICGATGASSSLCSVCRRAVGLELTRPATVAGLRPLPFPVVAAGEYGGSVARTVLGFKEQMRTDLVDVLGDALVRSILEFLRESGVEEPLVLVPVPSSLRSVGRRGFSPAELLAQDAAAKLERRHRLVVSDGLERPARVQIIRAQKKSSAFERQHQIQGSMRCARNTNFEGLSCLLVDDVVTTGASLGEAERVLSQAGARCKGAVTVAWVRRQGSPETE